jgi:hypothetical protein
MARPIKFKEHISTKLFEEVEDVAHKFEFMLQEIEEEVGRSSAVYRWARATSLKLWDFHKHLCKDRPEELWYDDVEFYKNSYPDQKDYEILRTIFDDVYTTSMAIGYFDVKTLLEELDDYILSEDETEGLYTKVEIAKVLRNGDLEEGITLVIEHKEALEKD